MTVNPFHSTDREAYPTNNKCGAGVKYRPMTAGLGRVVIEGARIASNPDNK